MNQIKVFAAILMLLISMTARAQDRKSEMRYFLKSSGYGALLGALVGTVSLVFEDKMGDHSMNVARGTSLGLYAGMLYGYAHMNDSSASNNPLVPEMGTEESSMLQIIPYPLKGSLAVKVNYTLLNF